MALEDGECKPCSSLFEGCATCNSYECYNCSNPSYIHTANGCYYEEPEPEPQSSVHSGSSGAPGAPSEQSKPLPTPTKSSDDGGSNGGMIAGIIIGVIVIVAIVAVAIYCVVTAGAKHGKIDPSIYEQDTEFESMSVL